MAVVAFWGDRIELSARLRLVIQLGLMAVVIVALFLINKPGNCLFVDGFPDPVRR